MFLFCTLSLRQCTLILLHLLGSICKGAASAQTVSPLSLKFTPIRFPTPDGLVDIPTPWDFRTQMRCIGLLPRAWTSLDLIGSGSHVDTLTQNYHSPLHLCATRNGGGNAVWNSGTYCYYDFSHKKFTLMPMQGFQTSFQPEAWAEIAMFCQLRCRCLRSGEDSLANREQAAAYVRDASFDDPEKYDMNQRLDLRLQIVPMRLLKDLVGPAMTIHVGNLSRHSDDLSLAYLANGALDLKANPEIYSAPNCRGDLPPWDLPIPFNHPENTDSINKDPIRSVSALCEAFWYKGDLRGNAGMVCKRVSQTRIELHRESFLAQ